MATRDIEPLGALDRTTKVVQTDTLNRRGVSSVRILSESKFFELVRDLVEEYLEDSINSLSDSGEPNAPHDERLAREYQRRWETLKTKQDIGVRQIERRMDRLARVLRRLESTLAKVRDAETHTGATERSSPEELEPVDRKSLMREMLLGEEADAPSDKGPCGAAASQ